MGSTNTITTQSIASMQPDQRLLGDRVLDLNSNNFLAWKARTDKIMDTLDFPGDHNTEPACTSTEYAAWTICSTTGAKHIAALCSSRLLDQINQSAKSHHLKLLNELRGLVFYFRFMDLPPELRNTVYDYLIPAASESLMRVRSSSKSRHTSISQYPAITSVSRQVRAEALPLFYSRCKFGFDFTADLCLAQSQRTKVEKAVNIAEHVRSWAECLSTPHLKHLCEVLLLFRVRGSNVARFLSVKFSLKKGLRIRHSLEHPLNQKSKEMLKQYGQEVERSRKMLGLQGESIIMAITGKEEIWKYGTLAC